MYIYIEYIGAGVPIADPLIIVENLGTSDFHLKLEEAFKKLPISPWQGLNNCLFKSSEGTVEKMDEDFEVFSLVSGKDNNNRKKIAAFELHMKGPASTSAKVDDLTSNIRRLAMDGRRDNNYDRARVSTARRGACVQCCGNGHRCDRCDWASDQGQARSDAQCQKCGQFGHIARVCRLFHSRNSLNCARPEDTRSSRLGRN